MKKTRRKRRKKKRRIGRSRQDRWLFGTCRSVCVYGRMVPNRRWAFFPFYSKKKSKKSTNQTHSTHSNKKEDVERNKRIVSVCVYTGEGKKTGRKYESSPHNHDVKHVRSLFQQGEQPTRHGEYTRFKTTTTSTNSHHFTIITWLGYPGWERNVSKYYYYHYSYHHYHETGWRGGGAVAVFRHRSFPVAKGN